MYRLNKQTIYKGNKTQVCVIMVDENGWPLPLVGITAIHARIQNQDDSFVAKPAITAFTWGVVETFTAYVFEFTSEETALFKESPEESLWLKADYGENSKKFEFKKFLKVVPDVY